MQKMKKSISILLALALLFSCMLFSLAEDTLSPKYVFMFIGDGMGSPQISATEYYLGTMENPDATMPTAGKLSFTDFENIGIMTTYDATSFCPDSASTATSMASGEKTISGVLNYNVDKTESFKLITEYAKEAGKKIGVVSSVSVDHATPAAYYAKATSRNLNYEIALQAVTGTTLDFLGGGSFLKPNGTGDQENIIAIAEKNGFVLANTNEAILSLNSESGRTVANVPDTADSSSMQYEIDRVAKEAAGEESISLAKMTQAAINTLVNEEGFFLMVEGGKIDWSCHANDATTSIYETLAFSDAVQVAIDFAQQHPDETLIIVTGDHETGGLTIGFATTAYNTHLDYLSNQTMSYVAFNAVIKSLRSEKATFESALSHIEEAFGLTTTSDQALTLTAAELESLKSAFELSMTEADARVLGDKEALLYGGYEPLSMAVCHILNNKAGIAYTSYSHTGLQIPVYAQGIGAEKFNGSYDNTDIFTKTMDIMGLSK